MPYMLSNGTCVFNKILLQNMATQVSAISSFTLDKASSDLSRPSTVFPPSVWNDHSLSHVLDFNLDDALMLEKHEELKQEMRNILVDVMDEPFKNLRLIDAIQHLTVDYHFKDEIETALKKLHDHAFDVAANDLNSTALRFRLLRQNGFRASCDVFQKFKDEEGNFKQSIIKDVEGMLSLYEASHLSIRGEDILDEAMAFTTKNLQSILLNDNVKSHLKVKIKHALDRPIRKCLQRLEARYYIDMYSKEESHNVTLLKLAKLDFKILQRLHQKELNEMIKWWKSLDVATRFPYVRDRIVECFFWIVGVYFEPNYCLARKILTKIIGIVSILDDIYDNYATFEELQLLTKAIMRWDIKESDALPDYLKVFYVILVDTYNGFEEELAKEGRSFCVNYAKEELKKEAEAFLVEAKWRSENFVPDLAEYMKVSLVSCGYQMLAAASFLGMGDVATKEVFEWISASPKIANASSTVCRLMDDIVSHNFEQSSREHVVSGIECYMRQHKVEEEVVIQLFREGIANGWKDINEECLEPHIVPMEILERVVNLTRATEVIYKDHDAYTNPHLLKHHVSALLFDPIHFTFE